VANAEPRAVPPGSGWAPPAGPGWSPDGDTVDAAPGARVLTEPSREGPPEAVDNEGEPYRHLAPPTSTLPTWPPVGMENHVIDSPTLSGAVREPHPSLAVQQLGNPGGCIQHLETAAGCLARAGFEGLSPEAGFLLALGAVLGETFAVDDLARLLGKPPGYLLGAVGELLQAGAVVAAGTELAFCSPEVRSALSNGLPKPVSTALHAEIGRMLHERGGCPTRAAEHLLKATSQGDRPALARLDEVALELLAEHPNAAADVATRALELTDASDANRWSRHIAAYDALAAARRRPEATNLARSALSNGEMPPNVLAELRIRLASALLAGGVPVEATQELEILVEEEGLEGTLSARGEALLLQSLLARGLFEPARERTLTVLAGRTRATGDAALSGALAALSVLRWREGGAKAAVDMMRAAAARGWVNEVPSLPFSYFQLAAMLVSLGEFDEAEERLGQSELAVNQVCPGPMVGVTRALRARLYWAAGRLDEAAAEAHAALGAVREFGSALLEPIARSVLACVALARGDIQTAAEQVAAGCRDRACPGPLLAACGCDYLEARVREAEGRPCEPVPPCRPLFLQDPTAAPFIVRMAMDSDHRRDAEHGVRCAEALAAASADCPSLAAASLHARGLLERRPDLLERAADLHRWPMARARAAEDAGATMRESADPERARSWMMQALASYEDMGAHHDAARVRARLRALGGRRRHRSRRERPVSGWDSLTKTERSVAALVALGLTNRQVGERMFLSHHTIDFHLRQIFRKLQVQSRVDLTRMTIEQESTQDDPSICSA
jgi:DNA-binding CsgD family transcriptional regulator